MTKIVNWSFRRWQVSALIEIEITRLDRNYADRKLARSLVRAAREEKSESRVSAPLQEVERDRLESIIKPVASMV